jgi:hypothetical protein
MDWVREHYPTAFPTARFRATPEEKAEGLPMTQPAGSRERYARLPEGSRG